MFQKIKWRLIFKFQILILFGVRHFILLPSAHYTILLLFMFIFWRTLSLFCRIYIDLPPFFHSCHRGVLLVLVYTGCL